MLISRESCYSNVTGQSVAAFPAELGLFRWPINGVLLVTGNMSPTIVLNSTMANKRLTPASMESISYNPSRRGTVHKYPYHTALKDEKMWENENILHWPTEPQKKCTFEIDAVCNGCRLTTHLFALCWMDIHEGSQNNSQMLNDYCEMSQIYFCDLVILFLGLVLYLDFRIFTSL